MGRREGPGQHVERQPAAVVFKIGLRRQGRGAVGLAQVLSLHELGCGIHFADGQHGHPRGLQLVDRMRTNAASLRPCGYQST